MSLSDSILANIKEPEISGYSIKITDMGVSAGKVQDCRKEIMNAIALCSRNGGGKVIFPSGKYLIHGAIHLDSGIELHLEDGAELIFGGDYADYLPVVKTRWEGIILYNYSPFIYANNKKNIAITGQGVINGNSVNTWNQWVWKQGKDQALARQLNDERIPVEKRIFGDGHYLRTPLIQFYGCQNILVEGITITDAPFWCIHPVFSKNIIIRNIVFAAHNHNNDGIDPDSSEDILIENVTFDNRDDNIAIKSGRDWEGRELAVPSRNILVRKCRFKGHNAICIGSEMSGGVSNVVVKDCIAGGTVRTGFYLKSNNNRGGEISHIIATNLEFDTCLFAIEFDADYKQEGEGFPSIFKDVKVEKLKAFYAKSYAISIQGSGEKPIHDVEIMDVWVKNAADDFRVENTRSVHFRNVEINGNRYDLNF